MRRHWSHVLLASVSAASLVVASVASLGGAHWCTSWLGPAGERPSCCVDEGRDRVLPSAGDCCTRPSLTEQPAAVLAVAFESPTTTWVALAAKASILVPVRAWVLAHPARAPPDRPPNRAPPNDTVVLLI